MGYYVVGHGGSADHGSEERVRGICRLLRTKPELYSAQVEQDWHYGLASVADIHRRTPGALESNLNPGDVVIATRPVGKTHRRGVKTVLWGISEPVTRRKVKELGRYDAIVVTDGLSESTLRAVGLGKRLHLAPDPAFLVDKQIRPLGGAFRQDTVGLCLSPAVCHLEPTQGLLYRSYTRLIRYILDSTPFQIALIPYCVQPRCNDCLLLAALEREFEDSGRVLRRGDGDCMALRGDISLCRCCVGTAGAVAAWSCGVPALCIGASVRAMGLGAELFGTWQETVVSVGALKSEEDLTWRFRRFLGREDSYRRRLMQEVPRRRQQARQWNWT